MAECSRCCGHASLHVVTVGGDPESKRPGRLLVYCAACRGDASAWRPNVSIPIELMTGELFVGLYRLRLTASVPGGAAHLVFGDNVPPGAIERADEIVNSDRGHGGEGASPKLPDLLFEGVQLIICGTAAGKESARRGSYYAGKGNKFWPMMEKLTSHKLTPEQFPMLARFGIGLTDLAKNVAGNDDELPEGSLRPDDLKATIERYRARAVAFNGKLAAAVFFGCHTGEVDYGVRGRLGETELVVLPSSSQSARGHYNDEGGDRYWLALDRYLDLHGSA